MGNKDPRVDAYIARSADFAKPILKHLRKIAQAGCPEVEETIKWQFPHFDYKGVKQKAEPTSRRLTSPTRNQAGVGDALRSQ
jgi:hypothetical protein